MSEEQAYKPYLAVLEKEMAPFLAEKIKTNMSEKFKGEVNDKESMFPKGLGAKHPFSFEDCQELVSNIGLLNGAIDKYVDSIVGDFQVDCKDANAKAIIDSFINDTNFAIELRSWIREGLMKGNGFMELDSSENKIRVLNANNMFVKRNKKGDVKKYTQWVNKNASRATINENDKIEFSPSQIAHLKINEMADEPYGLGYVSPIFTTLDFIMRGEIDVHKLVSRKAGAPIHVKVGEPGMIVPEDAISEFKSKLQYMNNSTEWVTDGSINMDVIDFKEIGKNLTELLNYDIQNVLYGLQVPAVLMGMANIPEGLAKVQLEAFQRKVRALQEKIESVIEEKIFRQILIQNGINVPVEFVWNLPGEEEINNRIQQIKELLGMGVSLDENMRRMLQLELARLLNFDDAEKFLRKPEIGLDDKKEQEAKDQFEDNKDNKEENTEKEQEENIKQPEVPGAKPSANAKSKELVKNKHNHMCGCGCGQQLTESESAEMTIKEWALLQEIDGFNYTDYVSAILRVLRVDKFEDLLAKNKKDLENGLLPQKEVEKLRVILKNGFKDNKTIRQIENEIKDNIPLVDRIKDNKITAKAESRPNMIARTETVRIANKGLLKTFNENNIKKVSFLAALSDRTCPECESLNGQIYEINAAQGVIPVHVACRCSWLPVTG